MKRYNQGFFFFGPMEMCKDGKWNEWKDTAKIMVSLHSIYKKEIEEKDRKITDLENELQFYKNMIELEWRK